MKVQKSVWILMMRTPDGWRPSIDFGFPWGTRGAARSKKSSLGDLGKMYEIVRYDLAGPRALLAEIDKEAAKL